MAAAVVVITALLGTSRAQPADLTGVWVGQQKCDRFDGSKFVTKFLNDVMMISQTGNEIRLAALLIDDTLQLTFQGTVIDDVKDPDHKGQAAFTECTTTPTSPYQETGRATKIDVRVDDGGKFEATSIFFEVGLDGNSPDTGTCAWTYQRVAAEDPGVPSCAEAAGGQSRRRR